MIGQKTVILPCHSWCKLTLLLSHIRGVVYAERPIFNIKRLTIEHFVAEYSHKGILMNIPWLHPRCQRRLLFGSGHFQYQWRHESGRRWRAARPQTPDVSDAYSDSVHRSQEGTRTTWEPTRWLFPAPSLNNSRHLTFGGLVLDELTFILSFRTCSQQIILDNGVWNWKTWGWHFFFFLKKKKGLQHRTLTMTDKHTGRRKWRTLNYSVNYVCYRDKGGEKIKEGRVTLKLLHVCIFSLISYCKTKKINVSIVLSLLHYLPAVVQPAGSLVSRYHQHLKQV